MPLKANKFASLDQYGRPIASVDSFGLKSSGPGMFSSDLKTDEFNADGISMYAPNASIANYVPSAALTQDFSAASGKSIWDNPFGKTYINGIKTDSPVSMGMGAAQGLFSGIMAMKNYGLAKQTLAQNKEMADKNYAAQGTTTNTAFQDRQRARVASNPGAYESVDSYMNKNRIA